MQQLLSFRLLLFLFSLVKLTIGTKESGSWPSSNKKDAFTLTPTKTTTFVLKQKQQLEGRDQSETFSLEEESFWGSLRNSSLATTFTDENFRQRRNALTIQSCPVGHFECALDPSLCVPQSAICNGKPDCPSGSDENDCDPGERKGCQCSGDKLFCVNVPKLNLSLIPGDVKFLDLSGSGVDSGDFTVEGTRFQQLNTLILSNTHQLEIKAEEFSQLISLQILHLTGNDIWTIPSQTFVSNAKLLKLYIGYNKLTSIHFQAFEGLQNLEELDLRHNRLKLEESDTFRDLKNLKILHLSYNEIGHLIPGLFSGLEQLEMLSLTKNKIKTILPNTFQSLPTLLHLYLSHNQLQSLEADGFCELNSLLSLNLNGNQLSEISHSAFNCLQSLQSLLLEQNQFGELEQAEQLFQNLSNLQYIYFDQFWMCSWAPHVRSCEPKGDGISSVENLLDNIILRVCVWIMGLVGVVGNGFVILSRLIVREKNRVHSFYIKNLAAADLLMGVFLLSIAFADVSTRGQFLARQHAWRHSATCQWSGLVSTLSSEASVLILTLITLDRYLSIVKPFNERRNAIIPAIAVTTLLWATSFSLSYVPLSGLFTGYFGTHFYTTNGLCLPLNIHNPFDKGWEYSFFLFVLINSVAFSFICFAYWRMLRIIQTSTTSIRSTQQKQDGMLTLRFGLVVLTDFLCWAPVIGAKAVAMSGVSIQPDFYAWLAVFVLPVNSALNPIIYTLTTKLFKQQVSHLTVGFRKRLGMATDESQTSSLYYRNRISRTLNTSLSSSMMHSTKRGPGPGPGALLQGQGARSRNRYTISAINSVIASSAGLQLPVPVTSAPICEENEEEAEDQPQVQLPLAVVKLSQNEPEPENMEFTDIDLNMESNI